MFNLIRLILQGKNILLISPEPWEHIFVSKHHYAVHLGRRENKVFFLGPPGKSNLLLGTTHRNVLSVQYTGFPKGLRFYPRLIQKYFIRRKFCELERLCNVQFDLVWSFDNSVFFDFSALSKTVVKISHIVDLTQNFQHARAAATADMCLGTTHVIVERLRRHNSKSFFVQHGYAEVKGDGEVDLTGNYGVKVGYAGNLNLKYIDWNTLNRLVTEYPKVGFYFAGPFRSDQEMIDRIRQKSNVFLLGEISSARLPDFYRQMDVLLLCYLADKYTDQLSNPHKLMEYLGSGKMVVSTLTEEHRGLHDSGLLLMSDKNEQVDELFRSALQNLNSWNSAEMQRLRRSVALANSYDRQIDRIELLLKEEVVDFPS